MLISNNITELILLTEERFFKKRFTHKDEASQAECALKITQKTSNSGRFFRLLLLFLI